MPFSNGKISPIHDQTDSQSDQGSAHQEIENGDLVIKVSNGRKDVDGQKTQEPDMENAGGQQKPTPPKLKLFEIHKFADIWDIVLMVVGSISALATGASIPIMMWLFQRVINGLVDIGTVAGAGSNYTKSSNCFVDTSLTGSNPYDTINEMVKWYCVLGACSIVTYWIGYAAWMSAAERQLRRMRYALFSNILRQEIGWFDCRTAGELSSRLVQDLENIREGIGFRVADFISLVARIIGSLVFSLYTGWKLTLVFLAISPLIIFSFFLLIQVIMRFTVLETKAYSTANSISQEVLGAIRTVTAFSGQTKEATRYRENLTEGKVVGIKKGLMFGITQAIVNIVLYGGIAIIFWYGPYLIRNECQNYTAGHWMVIFISCLTSTFSLVNLIPNLQAFAESATSGAAVFEVINRESQIDTFKNDGEVPSNLIGDIEFHDVHFTYPSRQDASILNGLSMKIPSGKTVALCGPSGCGKSTAIQMIQRFYDPAEGKISLDGRDLRSINLRWLRSNIGIVSQEPVLFFGSIEENIRFGKLDATDEEVQAAAKMANAHDFIMQLPQNYKTSSGDKLSGGQKQRVAIARALISNPRILLLDEATSALDNQGEKLVQEALDKAKEGRTTIVIAHRLSTIKNADIIVGIEKGKVVEYGNHDQLMQRKGLYYELVTAQSEKERLKGKTDDSDEEEVLVRPPVAVERARRMSMMMRRASIVSKKSITSELSDAGDLRGLHGEEEKSCCQTPLLIKVLQLNAPEWFYLLIGGIASLAFGAVTPCFSLVFSEVFGALAETDLQKQEDQIRTYTYAIFLIGVGGAVSQLVSSLALAKAGEELTLRMRIISFNSMLRQEIGWFDLDENNLGALVTRLSTDAAALKGFTGPTFSALFTGVGAFVSALVISFIAGWKLTLVILAFTPLMVFTGVIQGRQIIQTGPTTSGTSDAEDGGKYATQAIENIRTVVSLHQETYFINRFQKAFDLDFRRQMVQLHFVSIGNSLANSLMFFIHAASFGYGIELIKAKEMSFDNVFRVFSVITFAAMSVGRSVSMVPNYAKGKISAERIFALKDRQSGIDPEDPSGIQLSKVTGKIEFRDVRFRYPARPKVRILHNFDLSCEPSATTALVGPSGSGKSTTVALIQRFYDPLSGSILLDGHDIRTLNTRWLRSLLGLVQQEPVLFNLSIRDNIAYGDNSREVTDEEIENAARKANIHETIVNLPEGYQTFCGAKGGQLSGGQKQRIAIARALVRNPKILLLDEATSALDNKSERVVQEALDKARAGRTCLTIAHRLSTIRNSEKICVVDRGQIKESGRHEQLLQQQGIYYKLNMAQERPDAPKTK